MKDHFLLVDVHKYIGRIPKIVQKVPCLLVSGQHVLIEDELEEYIERNARPTAEIEPYYHGDMVGGLTDSFSYLSDNDVPSNIQRNFSSVDTNFSIDTPSEDTFDAIYNRKTLEAYRAERDTELVSGGGGR